MTSPAALHQIAGLDALPIDVVEAMYSPDFVELSSIARNGTPLSLPMSFTLDVAGNCLRFSSPVQAARLTAYAQNPRCSVLFSRVTAGFPPILLQGTVTLGEVAEGNQRGPARRFNVHPWRVLTFSDPPQFWQFPEPVEPAHAPADREGATPPARSLAQRGEVNVETVETALGYPSTVLTLMGSERWPVAVPVEFRQDGVTLHATLPELGPFGPQSGPAAALGHTWTKQGPRFIAFTGRAALDGRAATFHPARALRRPA